MKDKVLLTTVFTGYNYGSSLQALAGKFVLQELGYDCQLVGMKSLVKGRDIRLEKLMLIRPFSMNKIRRRTWIASYNIYFRGLITEGFVSRMHKMGKEVKVWTIQKPSHIPAHNLDGIITDRPDLFV